MNHGPLIFLGVFFSLACSWWGLVVAPQLQLGRSEPVKLEETGAWYPSRRPGQALQGAEIYRASGCNYCHSQQVRQTGTEFDLLLASAGSNQADVVTALLSVRPGLSANAAAQFALTAPKLVLHGATYVEAETARKKIEAAGAQAQLVLVPLGPDIERGWGKRLTVAQDYLYDQPVMLGASRIGPDLANIAVREPEKFAVPWTFQTASNHVEELVRWHLLHLYNPQITAPGSTMPPYPFLFEQRKIGRAPSPEALPLSGAFAPGPGLEIVPKAGARALVAYLLSLNSEAPLFEAPLSRPPAAPAGTNAPPAAATNSPAP